MRKRLKIEVHLLSQSRGIGYDDVDNAYVKDGFYCVYFDGKVEKYPLVNIFRVIENYI